MWVCRCCGQKHEEYDVDGNPFSEEGLSCPDCHEHDLVWEDKPEVNP